jgi:hypothetical protein
MLQNSDRLGFYRVGWKKFYNKTLALIENHKTNYEVEWVFNDDVYGNIDWSIPIHTPLMDLYKKRALQLREQYDYLVLYYSGGADGNMVLHSFIDNNIFIDELILNIPEPARSSFNNIDYSNKNYFSEIKFAAEVHLKKFQNKINPNTKITLKDFSKTGLELLEKDDWSEKSPMCLNITVTGILRQLTQEYDKYHIKLHDTSKTIGYVLGVDKPLIYFDGSDYYCYFMDTSAYHFVSPVDFNLQSKNVSTEFFYWTRDMPEIVIKQAQLIKQKCEIDPWSKSMIRQTLTRHISDYRPVLHPIIYPSYVEEAFQAEKPTTHIVRPMDDWFWATASDSAKQNYLNTIKYYKLNTNSKYMNNGDIQYGIVGHKSKFYKL